VSSPRSCVQEKHHPAALVEDKCGAGQQSYVTCVVTTIVCTEKHHPAALVEDKCGTGSKSLETSQMEANLVY
jgi:hypothetical protein